MFPFTFHNPTKVIFGKDTIGQAAREIPQDAKIMVTYGAASAKKYGVLDEVLSALNGFNIIEFGGIEANPDYDTLMKGVSIARERNIDFVLAVGGGSVIDGAKFMAAAIPYEGEPFSFLENKGADICRALPVGAVVTLPASGSEMNSRSIISRRSFGMKRALMNDCLFPRFAILDPTKTYTLPAGQTGNGVVDTFVHVLEQYLTYPVNGKVQDRLSEGLLLLLLEEGPRALAEPENYDVRANLMWAATLGLNGLIGAGVPQDWAAHRAGYELTVLFGLDHAQTLAVLVPAMLQVRAANKKEKLLQYARRIWGISSGTESSQIEAAIGQTRDFFEQMGVPTKLKDYGIHDFNVETIVEMLEAHGLSVMGEKNDVTADTMRKILKLCL
ncbi:MAG TPA: iron-containing alcohol dehydrogenase [Smithellaceae bacterium]|jgi:NADP-dependent alcohol dehydrogenase|nr:iron-containing alcohol dehydrogenase [Smithellaceae bacterium]HQM45695.1 iron-containing alcohol dehydrogenase [Smithellaceae bacterium]